MNEKFCILVKSSPKFILKGSINTTNHDRYDMSTTYYGGVYDLVIWIKANVGLA